MHQKSFVATLICFSCASSAFAADWPNWRGPESAGRTRETAAVTSWSPSGENLLWKVPIEGRNTPVLLNGRLFTIAPAGDVSDKTSIQERIISLDANSGKLLWEQNFSVFDTDVVQQRLGWTSLVGDPQTGYLYGHLTGGEFVCLDRNGALIWKRSLTEEFGRISGYGGRLHTPILDEDRVIISFMSSGWGDHGKALHRYLALGKKAGEVLWWAAPGEQPFDTTYATPAVGVVDGKRMLIAPNGDGNVYGMLARTGEKIWTFKMSKRGLNTAAIVDGNYAYVTNGEENLDSTEMGRVVCIDAAKTGDITATGEVWRAEGVKAGFASPALANGRLYVVDNSANLFAFDAKTGKRYWDFSLGRVGKGSPVVTADGVIYYGEQNGVFHILKDQGDKCVSLDKEEFEGPDHMVDEIYGSPVVAGGRVYFMTRYNTYALGAAGKSPESPATPPLPAESTDLGPLTRLHIVPADLSLAPGGAYKLRLVGFDALGHALPPNPEWISNASWALSGAKGKISADGALAITSENVFSAGAVTAKFGDITTTARVRVTPQLPITENFDAMPADGVPPGWIGVGGGKTKLEDRDGSRVLHKLASKEKPSPPFMRIRGYLGPPVQGGYTIQADVLGTPKGDRFKPDMGLINTRYMMLLMGNGQLWLESWGTMPRVHHELPFPWETNKWYRMKLRVEVAGREARLFGKVWLRDDAEPADWTINFTDPYPNREGSPGLYGYSNGTTPKSDGTEIFYDNLKVTKND